MLDAGNLLFILILILAICYIPVVIIIFIIYNKKISNKLAKSVDNYKKELKEHNDTLNKQLLKQLSEDGYGSIESNIKNNKHGKNLISIFSKLRDSIKDSCITAMNQIGAVRIGVYLFHNGTTSTHGISFLKMSCICEKVAVGSGIRERNMEHTSIPINLFDEMIEKLDSIHKFTIINNEETQLTSHKIFISAEKVKYVHFVALYDINNNLLGFIAVEMDRPYIKDEVDIEEQVLNELAKQLVPVLSYSDYKTIKTS